MLHLELVRNRGAVCPTPRELGNEGVTYVLKSGADGSARVEVRVI